MNRLLAWILLGIALAGCSESTQVAANAVDNAVDVAVEATRAIEDKSAETQVILTETTTPATLAVREAIEAITPEPPPPPAVKDHGLDQAVVDLIVRWEVGSPKQYVAKYQGVICPGGSSGPTIGIGYDLGTQTAATIRADWLGHPEADEIATASGQTGPGKCNAWRASHRGIRVTYHEAIANFTQVTLPAYERMAARTYRNGWTEITRWHQGGLLSNGYNRGFSTLGSRNAEKLHTKQVCVPGNDAPCTSTDLIASCRVWAGTNIYTGLCNRRKDEGRFVIRER